jgi:SHS2 domain-containing protein
LKYKLIDHTADLGIDVFGRDAADLFTNAALAMFDQIVDIKTLRGDDKLRIRVRGADWADLMVNWLRELLYFWTVKEQLIKTVDIESLSITQLSAVLTTDAFDSSRHSIKNEIKAVTYHQINVEQGVKGWKARVIFDI